MAMLNYGSTIHERTLVCNGYSNDADDIKRTGEVHQLNEGHFCLIEQELLLE